MTGNRLHDELRTLIRSVRRQWTGLVRLRAFARGTVGASLAIIVAVVIDRVLRPEGLPLVVLMASGMVLAAAAMARAIWLMPGRPHDRQVARFIEERAATQSGNALNDSLVSAVDAVERPVSAQPAFLPLMLDSVLQKLHAFDASSLITREEVRRQTIAAGAGGAILLVALVAGWPSYDRAATTARLRFFPGSVTIQVQPGNVRIPIGSPVHIRASVRGASSALTSLAPTLMVFANGQQRAVPMAASANGFEYVVESVDRTFSYNVTAGAARSARYTVTGLRPPRVDRIDLHYVYPSFAGLAPRDEQDGGDIYAPAGTRVHLRIYSDKAIASGELALSRSAAVPLQRSDDCTVEADLLLAKDDSYRIRLADEDGLTSRGEAEYFIRLMDDRPPDVRILRPSADQQITPLEEVAIEARADDDYGIDRFELVYGVAGGAEHTVPFERVTGTSIQKIGTRLLPAEDLGVKPGDVITYYARARDVGRGKRSTEATSDIFFLEVKPFNEEFTAAESQAGAGASDPQLESLIQAQKEIIASTWNVERRAQAARSAEDIKAIAAAQAELKARAEKQLMTRTLRGQSQAPAPEQRTPPSDQSRGAGGNSAATAVGAMGKALEALTSDRTKEALPHEMAALNGLLQLQADVRRRQVAQGTGAGNAWGNRVGQDLSALFDKELQRQQRTNYETRPAAEIKPDSDNQTSALDRIRDLAKRQEDLNRRQRELAASNLSADEMKRQLEKLTREQIELREQTEELLRRNGQRDAAGQSRSTRPSSSEGATQGQGSGELRGAADQMRSAASDLRRENPADAARNGERAASQLRRLERQMQGDSRAGSASASGDMKLEAQQIAQEQHRIATEAGRLGRNQGASVADARKRLADEKDKLASRVDELAKSAGQLSSQASSSLAKALNDSVRTLQRDKIADRLRDGARQLRDGQHPISAAGEEELARALDQVARGLGAGDSPLSSQLEQTRAIRDGLQRAEQQLREAEARARASSGNSEPSNSESARAMNGRQGNGGPGDAAREVERLRSEYQRELQRAEDALRRLNGGDATGSLGGATPEQHEYSRSAPGTEAFKQDRSGWESLRKNLDTELEKYEASLSDRVARTKSDERLSAGGSDRVPDAYSQLIARYFESLAKKKK
jgi:Domain of unknown function (DUF4175)